MSQLSAQPSRPDLPRSVRIPPNRSMLGLGLVAGLIGLAILAARGSLASSPRGLADTVASWAAFALFALLGVGCAFRLAAGLPIIEASELGIAIWLHGPYHRPFFAPWSRVRAIVLTQVARSRRAGGAGQCDALGIQLVLDEQFHIPDFRDDAHAPVRDAPRADLAWSSRAIGGDVREWVELLQQMKSAYADAV
jgi:hypothetical protein